MADGDIVHAARWLILTLANDRTAIDDGWTAFRVSTALEVELTAARAARRAAEENMVGWERERSDGDGRSASSVGCGWQVLVFGGDCKRGLAR